MDAQPTLPPPADVPEVLAGRYRLERRLGAGGMGAVYLAHDQTLDRPVAVKLLPEQVREADAVARFRREAQALARLNHPGIIQAHDHGDDGGRPFLVMEYVEGRSLAAVLADQGALVPTRAADCVQQAALALQHAHRHGLIHRDLKPSNLLLTADGHVKVLDLGLARFLQDHIGDPALTREGVGMGTPDYSAPEQLRNARAADARADVYALGCTLYHLLTGRVPYPGSSLEEKLRAHERQEPVPVEVLCPEVPAGLALALRKMMAKRPADRFQSAADAAAALAPYVAGSAPSFSSFRETVVWEGGRLSTVTARRPRRLTWVVTALLALLLAATAVGFGLLFRPGPREVAGPPGDAGKKADAPQNEAADPKVLTVSQKAEDGGRYRSIADALDAVQPGQTVRVLDDAVYREAVVISRAHSHRGITLEAVRGAVIETSTNRAEVVKIGGVSGVTVRGFRLQARGTEMCALVFLKGECRGVLLERLELAPASGGGRFIGVEIHSLAPPVGSAPPALTIRDCVFRKAATGVNVTGISLDYRERTPIRGVAVRDCQFLDCDWGVMLRGSLRQVQVVGNRFRGINRTAVQLERILEDAGAILVANNTVFESAAALRIWDSEIRTHDLVFRNNLILGGHDLDLFALDSDRNESARGPGDGEAYVRAWKFGWNWREGKAPPSGQGWLPPTDRDVHKERLDDVERDPRSPHFLRPVPGSPLAAEGAGHEDPALPCYVGALPPEGVEPWDWDRAWPAPARPDAPK
jgi:hypothetical protein